MIYRYFRFNLIILVFNLFNVVLLIFLYVSELFLLDAPTFPCLGYIIHLFLCRTQYSILSPSFSYFEFQTVCL